MSRRPPAGPDKAEQNRATLKQLVKLEQNKSCADCKRNKHPRWASWNLGIFICIRCSGIHRGMGTHISRVKSVDLDSWTDEQMQSMIKWGNGRANKYWEHKLAEGHVPNEAKIENFIRTKYDSKRWVMDGPIPDPSTLDDGVADDDVPLNVVQQQVKQREQSTSIRNGSSGFAAPPRAAQPQVDLFGDESVSQPARPSTTEPSINRATPPKAPAAAPKQTKPGEGLLGLDFFGGTQSAPPARPSSTGPNTPGLPGRTDLKQSILSLYASRPAAPPQQPAANAFGGMQSPPLASPAQPQSNAHALGGLGDAFGSLSFSGTPVQQKAAPFSNFAPPAGHSRQASQAKSPPPLSGGSFFDAKPAPQSKPAAPSVQQSSSLGDWGDFSSASPVAPVKSSSTMKSSIGDLFDMSAPAPPPKPTATSPPPVAKAPAPINYSAFNLSQPTPAAAAAATPKVTRTSTISSMSNMSSVDAWGSNDAWATPDTPAATTQQSAAPAQASTSSFKSTPAPASTTASAFDSGWGDPEPAKPATSTSASGFSIQQDEEFGGWSHASPVAAPSGPKQGGLGGNSDDLFGNVWE